MKKDHSRDSSRRTGRSPHTDEEVRREDLQQSTWELDNEIGVAGVSNAIAKHPAMLQFVSHHRESLCGWDRPPFDTLQAAEMWVREESKAGQEDIDRRSGETSSSQRKPGPYNSHVFLPPSQSTGDAQAREPIERTELDVLHFSLPGETAYVASTPQLEALAGLGWTTAGMSRCWSLGQATEYVLTGRPPRVPRLRLWTTKLLGGGQRCFLEVVGAVKYREMLSAYGSMREKTGAKSRSTSNADDMLFYDLIAGTPELSWPKRLTVWNEEHGERRIDTASGLYRAWDRALKRLERAMAEADSGEGRRHEGDESPGEP